MPLFWIQEALCKRASPHPPALPQPVTPSETAGHTVAVLFSMTQQEADTSDMVMKGNITFVCSDVYAFMNPDVSLSLLL